MSISENRQDETATQAKAQAARREWLGLMARTPAARLVALVDALTHPVPAHDWLRRPETGTVMVRGRAGGTGAPFNLGEVTVTRCALRLAQGVVGHGHVQGRDHRAARAAALVDALMQTGLADAVEAAVLAPLRAEMQERSASRARMAAATKVEFFTMARGQD